MLKNHKYKHLQIYRYFQFIIIINKFIIKIDFFLVNFRLKYIIIIQLRKPGLQPLLQMNINLSHQEVIMSLECGMLKLHNKNIAQKYLQIKSGINYVINLELQIGVAQSPILLLLQVLLMVLFIFQIQKIYLLKVNYQEKKISINTHGFRYLTNI